MWIYFPHFFFKFEALKTVEKLWRKSGKYEIIYKRNTIFKVTKTPKTNNLVGLLKITNANMGMTKLIVTLDEVSSTSLVRLFLQCYLKIVFLCVREACLYFCFLIWPKSIKRIAYYRKAYQLCFEKSLHWKFLKVLSRISMGRVLFYEYCEPTVCNLDESGNNQGCWKIKN